jgi:hypothetical protein
MMSIKQRAEKEVKALAIAMLYFGCWIGGLLLIKSLVLAEYRVAFHHWSMAVVGALVLSRMVPNWKIPVPVRGSQLMFKSSFKSYDKHAWGPFAFAIPKGTSHS